MSLDILAELQDGHAFDPAPRRDQLYDLHVPFDELTGHPSCEAALSRALRQGERVALVGISGSGKSSVTEHVLGPHVEDLAPLPIAVSIEKPEIATDPAEFAGHLAAQVRRWVASGLPSESGRAELIVPTAGRRPKKFTVAPSWMGAKVELAYELDQTAALVTGSSAEVIDQARRLIGLIADHELTPVIVLDDTDRWLASSWQPDSPLIRSAFFGRIIRLLAEELSCAAVIAVHPSYLADSDYQFATGFIGTTIHLPALPGPSSIGRILARRAARVVDVAEDAVVADLIDDGALQLLFDHYQPSPDLRRRILQVAHLALTLAVDAGADRLAASHIQVALTETQAPD